MVLTPAAPGDIIDIRPLGCRLGGHVTTAIVKSAQLELVHLVLPGGQVLRQPRGAGEITVQCLEGLIEVVTPAATRPLAAGQLVHLAAGEAHALRALTDATALLTICLTAQT